MRHPVPDARPQLVRAASGGVSLLVGFLLGDAPGAAVGAAAGALLSHALRAGGMEIWERYLSKRGKVRVARVNVLAAEEMEKRLKMGTNPRTDLFFTAQPPFRSPAEEIVESVLLKAERESEERKLPSQAKLITHILFDSSIDMGMAHQLLRFAETLSYRQYCILELAKDTSNFDLYEQEAGKIGRDKLTDSLTDSQTSFLSDCWDLKEKSLLWTGHDLGLSLYEIYPRYLNLQPLGQAAPLGAPTDSAAIAIQSVTI
jgi:hypothetical protein